MSPILTKRKKIHPPSPPLLIRKVITDISPLNPLPPPPPSFGIHNNYSLILFIYFILFLFCFFIDTGGEPVSQLYRETS